MKPGIKRFITHFIIITGMLLVCLLLIRQGLKVFTRHGQTLPVPDFSGMTAAQAREVAKQHYLRLEITDSIFLPQKARGTIFKQTPPSGEKVKKNRRILLTINSVLPRKVAAPSLVGFSLRQAKSELTAQNFQLGTLCYVEDFATNTVLEQKYEGVPLRPGMPINAHSVIDLVLGADPEYNIAYVPSVIGLNYELARNLITDYSLNTGSVFFDAAIRTAADSLAAIVVRQDPEASDTLVWDMGSRVHLFLSIPPDAPKQHSQ